MPRKTKAKVDAAPEIEPEAEIDAEPETTPELTKASAKPDTKAPQPTVVKSSATKQPARVPRWTWWVVAGVAAVVVVVFVGMNLFGSSDKKTNSNTATTNTVTNTGPMAARVIDGVQVPENQANTNVYAVMIENYIDARPQSGLDKASVVYETLAEGGITRFMALFPVGGPNIHEIGPVRSARPYYISWAQEYDHAMYIHAGGSPEALDLLKAKTTAVTDFNQFSHGGNFIRDDKRAAPHNLYTNYDLLYAGYQRTALRGTTPNIASWTFQSEPGIDSRPTTTNDVVINFSSFNYKVAYKYDRVQNQYQRYQADAPHVTRSGDPIYAKNIVVEYTDIATTQNNKGRMTIRTTGSGKMQLFRDGKAFDGTWKKDSDTARTQFLDASGNPLSLDPGQIWIEVVPLGTKVTS